MAQNVTIAGASYTDVPAVDLPITGGGTARFVDTSGDTVTADTLLKGVTATNAQGVQITGTFDPYPVGSIYMSVDSTSPATLFGGTWKQIKDTFLLAAGSTYSADTIPSSGDVTSQHGEATHTLTTDEMPSHSHSSSKGGSYLAIGVTSGSETTSGFSSGNLWGNNAKARADISSTGKGDPHNNMPPYLTVYMWLRTA